MFKKLFGKQEPANKTISIYAPMTGEVKELEEVPDPVFAEKMMGDGLAIDPTRGEVVSPVDGEIMQVFPTKHAIGIKAENGAEILIHIGLETVGMKGEGFTTFISEGDKVKRGDKLVDFDLALVSEKAKSTITPIIITNGDEVETINKKPNAASNAGESLIMEVTMK